eukprot:g4535.t1
MMGSADTRRGNLSAVVRIRSPVAGAADPGCSSDTAEPPELGVRRNGPRHVTVGVPECRGAPRQKETFEVTQVLPLDASPEEICSGVGGPVADWLWDGFNAVVLSYGQARSGKTTLLLGSDSHLSSPVPSAACSAGQRSPEDADDGRRRGSGLRKDGGAVADGEASGVEGGEGERGGNRKGGLLGDILRAIFRNAAATATASPGASAASAPADATMDEEDPAGESERHPLPSSAGMGLDVLNPLAGSWSPSRHACDGPGDSFDARPAEDTTETSFGACSSEARLHAAATLSGDPTELEGGGLAGVGASGDTAAPPSENVGRGASSSGGGKGGEEGVIVGALPDNIAGAKGGVGVVVALSAWELAGKNVTDLFVNPESGLRSHPALGSNLNAPGVNNGGSSSSNSSNSNSSNNNRCDENACKPGKSGGGGRGRGRNGSASSKMAEGDGSRAGGGVGGNGRGRRRSSRGRSGSDDSSTVGGGWPTGYPEGFLAVRAPSLAIALALVDTARRNSGCTQAPAGTSGDPGQGKAGKGGGSCKRGTAGAAAAAATTSAAKGHLFFRVVVYNTLEETVSTLHVVDLAGGWEPPSEKPAGRRGGKGSGVARPSPVSREWNSFDAMVAGLVPPAPPPPPPAAAFPGKSQASAAGDGAVDEEGARPPLSRGASSEPMPCSLCGAAAGRASDDGESCCAADASENLAPGATANTAKAIAPCGGLPAAELLSPPPPPLPPPPPRHPVFGSPKGKTFGGGGGGKLVEALRPLMSGNARTWLVVSVGGGGKGGPAAAWRALDVARRVTGVSTTCIRLRGVALDDLGLRSSDEVLAGNYSSRENAPETGGSAVPAGGGGNHVVNRRHGRTNAAAFAGPVKAVNTLDLTGLCAIGHDEAGLLSAATADQGHNILGSLVAGGPASSFPSSPASSVSGLTPGESLRSLADAPLGRKEGGEGAGTTHVDNFLAGFVRACNGGEGDRPRRISSGGGALGAAVVLGQRKEDVAAAWRAIGAEADAGRSGDGSRSNGHRERGTAAAASAPVRDPRNTGEPQRQDPPTLQGSPLRPGGRAAVVPPTHLPPNLSRPGAATTPAIGGNSNGSDSGAEHHLPLVGAAEREDGRGSRAFGGGAVGAARGTADGAGVGSPSASFEAGGNIDRMMSSLLEEVLPARHKGESSKKASRGGGGGGEERSWNSERGQVVADDGHPSVRRSCSPPRRNSPSAPPAAPLPASAGRSGHSASASDGAADGNSSGFLTPIEVLMHAPAGGGGHAGCPSCASPRARSQSLDVEEGLGRSRAAATRNGAAAAHRHNKELRQATRPADGEPQATGRSAVQAAAGPRVKDGQRSTSLSRADDQSTGGGKTAGSRARRAAAASGQRFDGNAPAAAETRRKPSRNSIDLGTNASASGGGDGGGGRRSSGRGSAPAGEAGAWETVEVGGAGSGVGSLGGLEEEVGAGVALMRRNHAALLRVVRDQEKLGKQMERRFEEKECDWLERVTSLEAELDGLRAEAIETRGRLRKAESSSPSAEVFERYEAHAGVLEAENTSLRDQNIALELRLLDLLRQSTTAVPSGAAAPAAADSATDRRNQRLKYQQERVEEQNGGEEDMCGTLKGEQTLGVDSLRPAARPASGTSGASSRFRVDGRIARPARGDSSPGGGAPMCAAVLKDLRRRLKEAEQEARAMRAERAAADKRDSLCQAQLRALTEQRSKVRELFLREKEHEAKLTMSHLESARAEAVADHRAAEVKRLRENQASLEADREALVRELAEERRKSRRFDEDRRAYGHIRRFIERHAGGRPAEWDEDVPEGGDGDGDQNGDGLGSEGLAGIERAERERRRRRQHHQHFRRGDAAGAGGIGCREDARGGVREHPRGARKRQQQHQQHQQHQQGEDVDMDRSLLVSPWAAATRRGVGGGLVAAATAVGGRSTGAYDGSDETRRWRRSSSVPRRTAAATASFGPDDDDCVTSVVESAERLYSDVYRNTLDARFRASRGLGGVARGAVGGDRSGGGGGGGVKDNNSHGTLQFSAGRSERPSAYNDSPESDPQRVRSSNGSSSSRRRRRISDGRKTASDRDWAAAGDSNSALLYNAGDCLGTTMAAWQASGTDSTAASPRRVWRGLGDETEETDPESESRPGRSAAARGSGAGLGTGEGADAGGEMGAAWRARAGSRLAGAAAGSRFVSRAGKS